MLIEIKQLDKQISNLKKKRNSLFARIETLKLRGPNKDQNLIQRKQKLLTQVENKLSALDKVRREL